MSEQATEPEEAEADGVMDDPPADVPLKLYGKLLAVRKELGPIAKNGEGDGYSYTLHADVLKAVVDQLDAHGILVIPEAKGVQRRQGEKLTTVALFFDLIDVESGESRLCEWRGSGEDSEDKALYKGYTGGGKYFLLNLFMLATFDDPERKAGATPTGRPPLRDVSAPTLPEQEREQLAAVLEAIGVAEGDLNVVDGWARHLTPTDYSHWMGLLTDDYAAEQTSKIVVATAHGYQQGRSAA